jgi:hypothetical protein
MFASTSINLDKLYEKSYIMKPTRTLFLNDKSEQSLSVSDIWCQTIV